MGKSAVERWAEGKPALLGGLFAEWAAGADDLLGLLEMRREGKRYLPGLPVCPVDEWLGFYRDSQRVRRVLLDTILPQALGEPEAGQAFNDLLDVLRSLRGLTPEKLNAMPKEPVSEGAQAVCEAAKGLYEELQEMAGHASVTTTSKHYTGVMPGALREAQGRLPFGAVLSDVSELDRGPRS
jgi:hypothetical protein